MGSTVQVICMTVVIIVMMAALWVIAQQSNKAKGSFEECLVNAEFVGWLIAVGCLVAKAIW